MFNGIDDKPLHIMLSEQAGHSIFPFDRLGVYEEDIPEDPLMGQAYLYPERAGFSDTKQTVAEVHNSLRSSLSKLLALDNGLARDLAVFAADPGRLPQILSYYGLTEAQLEEKLANKEFQVKVAAIRKDLAKDVNGMIRVRARMMLDAQIESIHEVALHGEHKDRISAVKLMAELADAKPKKEQEERPLAVPGTNIIFNFGEKNPFAAELRSISTGVTIDAEDVEDDE